MGYGKTDKARNIKAHLNCMHALLKKGSLFISGMVGLLSPKMA